MKSKVVVTGMGIISSAGHSPEGMPLDPASGTGNGKT